MGPVLRAYLGVARDYRGEIVSKVSGEIAAVFGQALVSHASDHPVTDGVVLVNILEELVTMDMPAAALRMYDAHRSIFPVNDFRAQFHLGNAAMLAGSLVQAEQAFTEAQKLVPGETAPYVNMAQILIHDDRLEDARKWLEAGLDVDPNHFGLWDMLAWTFKQLEIPDHTKSLERLARDMNSWAGLSLCADLAAPDEPERKLSVLEEFYSEGQSSEEFLVEYTAVLGQCGLYDRIAPVIWRHRSGQALNQPQMLSWKLQLHLAQAQLATGQYEAARESLEALLRARDSGAGYTNVPANVLESVVPALIAEIDESVSQNQVSASGSTTGAKNESH
jgi:tetratricopeptide (TPR) repeat protein